MLALTGSPPPSVALLLFLHLARFKNGPWASPHPRSSRRAFPVRSDGVVSQGHDPPTAASAHQSSQLSFTTKSPLELQVQGENHLYKQVGLPCGKDNQHQARVPSNTDHEIKVDRPSQTGGMLGELVGWAPMDNAVMELRNRRPVVGHTFHASRRTHFCGLPANGLSWPLVQSPSAPPCAPRAWTNPDGEPPDPGRGSDYWFLTGYGLSS